MLEDGKELQLQSSRQLKVGMLQQVVTRNLFWLCTQPHVAQLSVHPLASLHRGNRFHMMEFLQGLISIIW